MAPPPASPRPRKLPDLPDKQYFKIGEVARLAGVKTSVLRFWETEFPTIRPSKSRSNQRLYTRRQVENVLHIRELLYEQKYTIAGARKRLRSSGAAENEGRAAGGPSRELLQRVKKELEELLRLVDE